MKETARDGASARPSTKERILMAALELFNERGTLAVSTNHIAEAAGIAIGNFYYHYRNREEIIRALFERNAEATRQAFRPPADAPLSLTVLEDMVTANYDILWTYRFFYRELNVLLNRDPELSQAFRDHRAYGFRSFEGLLSAYAAVGVMTEIPSAEERHRLAVTVWLVSEFYIPYLESHCEPVPAQFASEGIALLRQVLTPYLMENLH